MTKKQRRERKAMDALIVLAMRDDLWGLYQSQTLPTDDDLKQYEQFLTDEDRRAMEEGKPKLWAKIEQMLREERN